MDNATALMILFSSFAILFIIKIPLAVSLLISSCLVIVLDPFLSTGIVAMRIYSGVDSFVLLAIPGFMLSAFLLNRIGATADIVKLSDLLVGRVTGGLAHINVISSMLMGGVSGSSTADVAGVGAIIIPGMNGQGYNRGFSAALTAASSTIGSIIPPSILMVIYGASANISVGALFIAGYLPGIMVGLSQLIICYYYARTRGIGGDNRKKYTKEEVRSILLRGFGPLSVMVIIIGGIVGGVVTATESAALATFWVIFMGIFFYKKLTIKLLYDAVLETSLLTAIVMFCVGAATLFGWLMAYYEILTISEQLLTQYASTPFMFMIFVSVLFLILGTFMDPAPAMLIFVPVVAPIAVMLGVNPLVLGILVVMALAIGKITPPYGISLLLACTIAEIPLVKSLKWNMLFFTAFCIIMLLIILFPSICIWPLELIAPSMLGL